MVYQSATVFGFSAVEGRTKRFPPTSLPLQENVVWILQRDGPTWSQLNTGDLSTAALEGAWDTSGESVLHSLVETPARVDPLAGAPALGAYLRESTPRSQWRRHWGALVLATLRVQSPSFLLIGQTNVSRMHRRAWWTLLRSRFSTHWLEPWRVLTRRRARLPLVPTL